MGKKLANKISESELLTIVSNVKNCTMCSVTYVTETDALDKKLKGGKSNPYYGRLKAITNVSGIQLFADYGKAVNNRLKGTDEVFEPEDLPWGEWFVKNKLITHKGKFYVRFYVTKSEKAEKVFYLDGERVNDDIASIIAENIRERKESARQKQVGIAPKDMVKPFTLGIGNIVEITLNGATYDVIH